MLDPGLVMLVTQSLSASGRSATECTAHNTIYTIKYTLYTIHYTPCTIPYTLYPIHYRTILQWGAGELNAIQDKVKYSTVL